MSLFVRRIIVLAAGAVAGLLAWPLSELLIDAQPGFASFLVFTVTVGAGYGFFFGLAFGSVDGIVGGVPSRKWAGLVTGALVGLVAGAAGTTAGQAIYLALGQSFLQAPGDTVRFLPLARAVGWAVMGAVIGAAEGFRLRSAKRAWIGALGGFVGGIAGGLVFEYAVALGGSWWVRPLASVLFGLLLAAGFAAIERGFLLGTLVLVTGALRGREYPLPPGRTTFGSSLSETVSLLAYPDVAPRHAAVFGDRAGLRVRALDGAVLVNEEPVSDAPLKYDDVIDVGSARFFLKTP